MQVMMKFPFQMIDLTHGINSTTPSWDGPQGFIPTVKLDYKDCANDITFRIQQINMHAGIGTHIDAPAHCDPAGNTVERLQLDSLVRPCVVIDVSSQEEQHYSVSVKDIEKFEAKYGHIEPDSFVMIRTGWEQYWKNPDEYCNQDKFPTVSESAAKILLSRGVAGLGIDTLSSDRSEQRFPVHHLMLKAGKYLIENAANLSQLPVTGSFIGVFPMKGEGLTEAPIRLVAFIPA